jgi:hypothetical protein
MMLSLFTSRSGLLLVKAMTFRALGISTSGGVSWGQLGSAEDAIKASFTLHQQAGSVVGLINDLHRLEDLYLKRGQLEKAYDVLKAAQALHQQVRPVLGEGT